MKAETKITQKPNSSEDESFQHEWVVGLTPNTFLNCDCMELMKKCPDNYFDLAIVDPPYGLGKRTTDGGTNWLIRRVEQAVS